MSRHCPVCTGAVLTNYYVMRACSPTRAALQTGRYTIRYGFQSGVLEPAKPYGPSTSTSTSKIIATTRPRLRPVSRADIGAVAPIVPPHHHHHHHHTHTPHQPNGGLTSTSEPPQASPSTRRCCRSTSTGSALSPTRSGSGTSASAAGRTRPRSGATARSTATTPAPRITTATPTKASTTFGSTPRRAAAPGTALLWPDFHHFDCFELDLRAIHRRMVLPSPSCTWNRPIWC